VGHLQSSALSIESALGNIDADLHSVERHIILHYGFDFEDYRPGPALTESALGTVAEYQTCRFFLTVLTGEPQGTVIDGLQKSGSNDEAQLLINLLSRVSEVNRRSRGEWALNFSDVCDQMYMWVLVLATLTFRRDMIGHIFLDSGISPTCARLM